MICKKLLILIIILFFSLFAGCSHKEPKQELINQPEVNQEPVKQEKPKVIVRPSTELEKQIYQYLEDIWDEYERKYGIEKAEPLVFINASNEFNKPIIEIYRAYTFVQYENRGWAISEDVIDVSGMDWINSSGFVQKNGKWYYDGKEVDVGTPLPTPEHLKPQEAQKDKAIDVYFEVETELSELKKVKFNGKTNLPDGTSLMISFKNDSINYWAQDKVTVSGGNFETSWFSDGSRPASRLASGTYVLIVSTPYVAVMDSSVKSILGERGENLTGKYVVFGESGGNRVEYSQQVSIQ